MANPTHSFDPTDNAFQDGRYLRVGLHELADGTFVNVSANTPMPTIMRQDFWQQAAAGNIPGHSVVHKFGTNPVVGLTYVPLAIGGTFMTPQVGGATALRCKAGDANDTVDGTGAQEITIQGLDETGTFVTDTIATAGASASAATTTTYIRLFRAWVSKSGTYATQSNGSHAAAVTIEDAAGVANWQVIYATDFPRGQSQTAVYTVPLGFTAYVSGFYFSIDSNKLADILLFQRQGILQTAPPYEAMRAITEFNGLSSPFHLPNVSPLGPYPALTDIGFMAKVSAQTGAISADFEILLIEDGY